MGFLENLNWVVFASLSVGAALISWGWTLTKVLSSSGKTWAEPGYLTVRLPALWMLCTTMAFAFVVPAAYFALFVDYVVPREYVQYVVFGAILSLCAALMFALGALLVFLAPDEAKTL